MNPDVRNIGLKFLQDIDNFLKNNIGTLSCDDISRIYWYFFDDLKNYKGNSHGFTGLSEYLIFRSLYHMIGEFSPRNANRSTGIVFQSKADNNLLIGQSMRVEIGKTLFYPDIAVMYAGELISIAQIKVYPTNGNKEIDTESAKIQSLRKKYPEMAALLIMFQGLKNNERLKKLKDDKIDSLILKNNSDLIRNEMGNILPGSCKSG